MSVNAATTARTPPSTSKSDSTVSIHGVWIGHVKVQSDSNKNPETTVATPEPAHLGGNRRGNEAAPEHQPITRDHLPSERSETATLETPAVVAISKCPDVTNGGRQSQ